MMERTLARIHDMLEVIFGADAVGTVVGEVDSPVDSSPEDPVEGSWADPEDDPSVGSVPIAELTDP